MPGVRIPGAGRRRAVVALAVGWVVVAGGTAGAVVALGRDGSSQGADGAAVPRVTVTAAVPSSASRESSSSPSPSLSLSPSSSSSSSSPSPTPTSTVTGKVAGAVHSGDLRFFLMAAPSDASVIGSADGDMLTKESVAALYSNSSDVLKKLNSLGFKDGATRRYQTGDGKFHVTVRLLHFSSAQSARTWALGDQPLPGWKAFGVPGYPDEKAYDIAMDASSGEARLRGVGFRGDVFFEVNVFGQPPVNHGVLIDRVRKQIIRLDTGS